MTGRDGEVSGCLPASWSTRDHTLGRGRIRPENVYRTESSLRLVLPGGSFDGAEIVSGTAFRSGVFETRMRCDLPNGAICAFFLHEREVGNRADEIDIEVVPDDEEILLVTWRDGIQTNIVHHPYPPDFDATTAHNYRIEHFPERTAIFIDDYEVASLEEGLPTEAMNLYVNAWWPTWTDAKLTDQTGTVDVEWIRWERTVAR